MEKSNTDGSKAKAFFKKNLYYIIIGFCVLAIGAMVTVALVVKNNTADNPDTPFNEEPQNNVETPTDNPVVDNPSPQQETPTDVNPSPVVEPDVNPEPVVFAYPVADAEVSKDYTMDTVVYWSTLKHYAVHNGMDFSAETNATVVASYGGKVTSVTYDVLNGNVVKIDHGNGLITTYGSLDEVSVTEGQSVNKGDKLGIISQTATNEMLDSPHVHFCVYENGTVIDPMTYLPGTDK